MLLAELGIGGNIIEFTKARGECDMPGIIKSGVGEFDYAIL